MQATHPVPTLLLLLLLGALTPPAASAARTTWTGAAGNGDWFTAGNWNSGAPTSPASDEGIVVTATVAIARTDLGSATVGQFYVGGDTQGNTGATTVNIGNGASLVTSNTFLGTIAGSQATLNVTGAGAAFTSQSQFYFGLNGPGGNNGTGVLTASAGATVTTSQTYLGYGSGSHGTATLTGPGTAWNSGNFFSLGYLKGTGTLTVADGATLTGAAVSLGDGGSVTTGTLNVGNGAAAGTLAVTQVQGLNFAGTVNKLSFNHNESAYVFTPQINGVLTVEQKGSGTTVFNAAKTYSGGTLVTAGTLRVNNPTGSGTGTGAVTVSGGTLGGSGTITGPVTVQGGGTPGPGHLPRPAHPRRQPVAAKRRGSGIELGGTLADGGANQQYDQVFLAGPLTLDGILHVAAVNGFTLLPGQTFVLLDNTGSGPATATPFANAPGGVYTDAAGDTFQVNYAANADAGTVANDVTLTAVSVVPEPTTGVLLIVGALGGLALARWRRAG